MIVPVVPEPSITAVMSALNIACKSAVESGFVPAKVPEIATAVSLDTTSTISVVSTSERDSVPLAEITASVSGIVAIALSPAPVSTSITGASFVPARRIVTSWNVVRGVVPVKSVTVIRKT